MRYVLLASGMALFGSATPVSKLVGEAFPAMLASGLRMATAAAVLLPFLLVLGEPRALLRTDRGDRILLLLIGAVGTFGFTLFLLYGMREAPGSVGAVVMATTPAVTAAGAILFLGDRADRWLLLALAFAVAGVGIVNVGAVSGDDGGSVVLGASLVFAAVCCEGAYTLLGKQLTTELTPVAIASAAAVIAGLLFAPLAVWQAAGFEWSSPAATDWLALAWWGAGTMGLGSVLWFQGMRDVSATTASAFMAVMPVSALLLSYLLLDEGFAWSHAAGMAAVLAALAAITYRDGRRANAERG